MAKAVAPEQVNSILQVLFEPLLVSHLLTSRLPKQIALWLIPEPEQEGTTKLQAKKYGGVKN